jgi:hypothetical protein
VARPRQEWDSASLIAKDEAEAQANRGREAVPIAQARAFEDQHGPSIKCPNIYEALKRKGYDKEKAARISNSRC